MNNMRTAAFSHTLLVFVFLLILTATANTSVSVTTEDLEILFPTTTTAPDPRQCATENLTKYFDVPTVTGALNEALSTYAQLLEACTETTVPYTSCPFPASSLWCGFSTAAPSTLLDDWSSFASVQSVWWSNHSSAAYSLAQNCPSHWQLAGIFLVPFGYDMLQETIIMGGCYAEAHPTTGSSTTTSTATPVASSRSSVNAPTPTQTQAPKQTQAPNGAFGRVETVDMWMVAGCVLAAVAVIMKIP